MIPMLMVLRVRWNETRGFTLWLPLILIWLLLLPLVLVLLPFAFVALLIARISPFRSIAVGWSILSAIRGTHVEVAAPGNSVFIHVY